MTDAADGSPSERPGDALWDDWDVPPVVPASPEFHLEGFDGPLSLLLDLAERERIDLARISLVALMEQLAAALLRYERHVAIERRAGWLVLAGSLLVLRSRLILGDPEAARDSEWEAERGRTRLRDLQFVRAAAAWLEAAPQLGRDVFTRPRRGPDPRVVSYMALMEACLAVLERDEERAALPAGSAAPAVYRPNVVRLFRIPEALVRMRAALTDLAGPVPLWRFLPKLPEDADDRPLLARSAVSSTFVAGLELARLAEIGLEQPAPFDPIAVHVAAGAAGSERPPA